MYVGDHPENDVRGAENVGMVGVWKRDLAWGDVMARYVIDELKELPLIIQQ